MKNVSSAMSQKLFRFGKLYMENNMWYNQLSPMTITPTGNNSWENRTHKVSTIEWPFTYLSG